MATFIIADLHLSESKPILTNALSNFYERNTILNDRVIIAGDMFDFFVGVDSNSSFHQKIRDIITKAKQRGVITMFQAGNRDFLLDEAAAEYFGMKLIKDFYILNTSKGKALLLHGDQLCLHDRSYQTFRAFAKNRFIRFCFMLLPLSVRISIAQKIRNKSQEQENRRADYSEKVLQNPIVKKAGSTFLQKTGCTLLIHGHFHVFGGEQNAFGDGLSRLGLGMWDSHYSYIKIDRTDFKLVQRAMEKNF
ncbi:UDP-2,3-diacylglucosamine hydrolase [Succinivibrio dextrinosolvens DSM 3072]|uniref:UDP-2,3-diacylglucosamine hydrolase n=1 Tax=Succinivibrio dextrinosolvens DSM 3072 TaxID=1123324 RepID=A0A1T4UVU3_9GAMM|nr:UDP-2,3-diacylglucosamine diphosphatase [Succinivibrio dextrinosolvens]SKA56812.1 UDP-2,3-diacylglucosamine hydrolase [Succinivibrio dextrinosolvens DSM 3072]